MNLQKITELLPLLPIPIIMVFTKHTNNSALQFRPLKI